MNLWWYRYLPRLTFLARRLAGASYEREMQLLDGLCDPSKIGIDVGAKVGMYTYRIRDRSSQVVAFEPNPDFQTYLRAVFEGKRGHIEGCALSGESGVAQMRLPYDKSGRPQFGRSTIDPGNALSHEVVARTIEISVPTRRLDDVGLANVGFIKVDVEGHEFAVLAGAEQTIRTQRPNLLIECNDEHHPGGVAKLATWFADHDYSAWFLFKQDLLPMERYDRAAHWDSDGVENFIGIPRDRGDVVEKVRALASRTSSKPRAI